MNYISISVNYLCHCPRHPLHCLDVCPMKHQILPPRIRYIDPRLMPKVSDISDNKGSCCRGRGLGIIPSESARRDIITVRNNHTGRRYFSIYRTSNSTSLLLPPFLLPPNDSSCFSRSQISLPHRNISIIWRADACPSYPRLRCRNLLAFKTCHPQDPYEENHC